MMQPLVPLMQNQMGSSSKTQGVCMFLYPEHLTQTADPTHAALTVGKRRSLSRRLTVKNEPTCFPILRLIWPGSAFVFEAGDDFAWPLCSRMFFFFKAERLLDAMIWQPFKALHFALCFACHPHVRSIGSSFCGFHYGSMELQADWHVPQPQNFCLS